MAPEITLNINEYDVLPYGTKLNFSSIDPNNGEKATVSAKLCTGSVEKDVVNGDIPQAGVYQLKLTAKDIAGNVTEKCVSFVIYDPNGGFVTGGGWINSPAGAYSIDPTLSGKASFGFVSQYKKGATIPTGQTEFQFKVGNLNFQSTSYEWLVVAGSRAQYKGKGTINGQGEYVFMLTAIDGDLKTTDKNDRFRIKIWDIKNDTVVYDNQINTDDTADLTGQSTVLGGGSIVIHK